MTAVLRALAVAVLAVPLLACAAPPADAAGTCTTAASWQDMWAKLPYNGDGNFSAAIPGARSAWVTGDSVPRAGGPWASNTIVTVSGCTAGQFTAVVPDQRTTAGVTAWWPGPVAAVGSTLYSPGSRILRTPGEGFGFRRLGGELATFTVSADGIPRLARLIPTPASPAGVRWSSGAWAGPDGWLYMWGTTDGVPGQWGVDAYVSRVDVRTLSAWRYWDGRTWSTSAAAAAPLLRASADMSTDTAFSVRLDAAGWHIYTRRVTWTSSEHGEYVGGPKVWTWRPGGTEPGYLPAAHPEVRLADGQQLVSVNVVGVGARFLQVTR